MRDGKITTINVAVGKLNDPTAAVDTKQEKSQWGLAMQNIRPEERRQMGLTGNDGVLVTSVMPASPAANAGVQPGDVILQVNQTPVSSVEGVKAEVAKAKGDKPLLLLLRRAMAARCLLLVAQRREVLTGSFVTFIKNKRG
jgi:serine protease Do